MTNFGYMRVSKADGSQTTALQLDALIKEGVIEKNIYSDTASGKRDARPGLTACLKALQPGDTLLVWKLDRLGRDLRHLVNLVHDLNAQRVGFRVLTGHGAAIDTTTSSGKLVFGIFAALVEFERDLIVERTNAGLAAARARGRTGGAKFKMTPAKLRLAQAAMANRDQSVEDLCKEMGITRTTLYRYVDEKGSLRDYGLKLLGARKQT
jgi:DNA invertase Pin-like site-specific DNA recombinase